MHGSHGQVLHSLYQAQPAFVKQAHDISRARAALASRARARRSSGPWFAARGLRRSTSGAAAARCARVCPRGPCGARSRSCAPQSRRCRRRRRKRPGWPSQPASVSCVVYGLRMGSGACVRAEARVRCARHDMLAAALQSSLVRRATPRRAPAAGARLSDGQDPGRELRGGAERVAAVARAGTAVGIVRLFCLFASMRSSARLLRSSSLGRPSLISVPLKGSQHTCRESPHLSGVGVHAGAGARLALGAARGGRAGRRRLRAAGRARCACARLRALGAAGACVGLCMREGMTEWCCTSALECNCSRGSDSALHALRDHTSVHRLLPGLGLRRGDHLEVKRSLKRRRGRFLARTRAERGRSLAESARSRRLKLRQAGLV